MADHRVGSSLRFVVADDNELVLRTIRRYLEDLGHEVVAAASSGEELVAAVEKHLPDMAITDIRLPGIDGLEATQIFTRKHKLPVIVISGCEDQPTFDRASVCPVQAYLPKPIKMSGLAAAIAIATKRFTDIQLLSEEVESARRRLSERAIVEKAKGVLMKRADVDEATAYERIRLTARNSCRSMGEVARSLLLAEETFSHQTSATC
jgi:response regulator NasT